MTKHSGYQLVFRVFSDVGFSGNLAINEKPLIAELLRSKARRYQQVFDRRPGAACI